MLNLNIVDAKVIFDASWVLLTFADGTRAYCDDGRIIREAGIAPCTVRHFGGRAKNPFTCRRCYHLPAECYCGAAKLAAFDASRASR